jgi:hypothetical protein
MGVEIDQAAKGAAALWRRGREEKRDAASPACTHRNIYSGQASDLAGTGGKMPAMIAVAVGVVVGGLAAHLLAHYAILHGLRAPREAHDNSPRDLGLPAERVIDVRIPGPRDKALFGWLVIPAIAETPAPAVLVMHGWAPTLR